MDTTTREIVEVLIYAFERLLCYYDEDNSEPARSQNPAGACEYVIDELKQILEDCDA